jgi:hypothetical protein
MTVAVLVSDLSPMYLGIASGQIDRSSRWVLIGGVNRRRAQDLQNKFSAIHPIPAVFSVFDRTGASP